MWALEWTSQSISIYFFPRNSSIPSDISGPSASESTPMVPDPSKWGTPSAVFSGCNIDQHFKNMSIIFDTTFCGDWAGKPDVWTQDKTCAAKAGTCADYVKNNPQDFQDAYWAVNSVRVWQ